MTPPKKRTKETFTAFLRNLERHELLDTLRDTVLRHHNASLQEVYGDGHSPNAFAARLECFWQLERLRWTPAMVGILFDRSEASVNHALYILRRESGMQGVVVDDDTVVRLARTVAEKGALAKKRAPEAPETGEIPPVEEM